MRAVRGNTCSRVDGQTDGCSILDVIAILKPQLGSPKLFVQTFDVDCFMASDHSLPVMEADADGLFPMEGLPPLDFEASAHASAMQADSDRSYMISPP